MLDATVGAPSQTYHSEDNISELCICVRLGPRHEAVRDGDPTPAQPSEQAPLLDPAGHAVPPAAAAHPAAGVGTFSDLPDHVHTEVFKWMERVVGRSEVEQANIDSVPPPEGRHANGCLFSRALPAATPTGASATNDDAEDEDVDGSGGASSRCCCCRRSRACRGLRTHVSGASAGNMLPCDRLQIWASLVDGGEQLEVLLCEARAHNGGRTLEVQPPLHAAASFSSGAVLPYAVELPSGGWHEYAVENHSHVPTQAELQWAREQRHGFDAAVPQMRRNIAGTGFEQPREGCTAQFSVMGEIVAFEPLWRGEEGTSSEVWQDEALFRCTTPASIRSVFWRPYYYVVYELSLPVGGEWELAASSTEAPGGPSARGPRSTQRASLSGRVAYRGLCVFNEPLEVHLWQRDRGAREDTFPLDPVPPRFILQVLRVDSWDRHSLHGYSFVDVPRTPGQHEIQAKLWAPLGTIRQQFSSKLCGAYLPLASPHLVANADMHRLDALPRNRSALRAQTAAGVVHVRLQVIRQRAKPREEVTPSRGPRPASASPTPPNPLAASATSALSTASGATGASGRPGRDGLRQRRRHRRSREPPGTTSMTS